MKSLVQEMFTIFEGRFVGVTSDWVFLLQAGESGVHFPRVFQIALIIRIYGLWRVCSWNAFLYIFSHDFWGDWFVHNSIEHKGNCCPSVWIVVYNRENAAHFFPKTLGFVICFRIFRSVVQSKVKYCPFFTVSCLLRSLPSGLVVKPLVYVY